MRSALPLLSPAVEDAIEDAVENASSIAPSYELFSSRPAVARNLGWSSELFSSQNARMAF